MELNDPVLKSKKQQKTQGQKKRQKGCMLAHSRPKVIGLCSPCDCLNTGEKKKKDKNVLFFERLHVADTYLCPGLKLSWEITKKNLEANLIVQSCVKIQDLVQSVITPTVGLGSFSAMNAVEFSSVCAKPTELLSFMGFIGLFSHGGHNELISWRSNDSFWELH